MLFTFTDIFEQIDKLKIYDLKEFAKVWMQELQIQMLIQGNMQKEHCLAIVDNVLKNIQCNEIDVSRIKNSLFHYFFTCIIKTTLN